MRPTALMILTVVALVALLPGRPAAQAAGATASTSSLEAELHAVNRAMEAAFNRGDLLAVARFYADDALMLGPGGERVSGRRDIDRYWTGVANPRSWKLEAFDIGGGSSEAYQYGRSTLVTVGRDGSERTSVTDFVVIWKRGPDGRWRIALDMWPGSGS